MTSPAEQLRIRCPGPASVAHVTSERMRLSKAAVAELATAALDARDRVDSDAPAFIVVAVPAAEVVEYRRRVEEAVL